MKYTFFTATTVAALAIAGPASAAGNAAAGEAKAAPCAMCHGATGGGTTVGPKIAGKDAASFVQALKDYQSGKKDNVMMKAQAGPLTPDDMANLAAYFGTLK